MIRECIQRVFSVTRVRVCFPTEQSNDVQSDLLTDTTHSHQRKNKKRVKQCWMPTTTNPPKKSRKRNEHDFRGLYCLLYLLQAPSLLLLQYFIWGDLGVLGLLEWVSFLGTVCKVCVCVVLFMGELHSSVITLIYGPPLPHLTVRVYVDEIDGSLIQTHTQTYTHLPTYLHEHTIMQRIFLNWVLG